MAGRMHDSDNYNRIFIIGPKDCMQEEVRETFEKFGNITDIYIPRDKTTRESKGIIYVTFSKASEAALAIEKMNGKGFLKDSTRPLKVVLASSKSEGNVRDPNEESKMMRLFIVVPPKYNQEDIEDEFKKYGEIETVRFVKDRTTGERRSLAYVKFYRAYDAAVALETCPTYFKAVFAETPRPRGSDVGHNSYGLTHSAVSDYRFDNMQLSQQIAPARIFDQLSTRSPLDSIRTVSVRPEITNATLDLLSCHPHPGQTVLEASFRAFITCEQASRLFDLVPGLECCNYEQSTGKAYVKYSTPQAAAYARDKLDLLEYPPGCRISVRLMKDINSSVYSSHHTMSPYDVATLPQAANTIGNVQTLVESIQKATTLLQQAGIGLVAGSAPMLYQGGSFSMSAAAAGDNFVDKYCSMSLPDKQPLAPRDSVIAQRLFIVSQPDTFDDNILEDCFCRFGNMIGAYFMPGKKFGYVKYASEESARAAMDRMHGQVVCGNRLKVLPAEPQRKRPDSSSIKRDHHSSENYMSTGCNFDDDSTHSPKGKHSRFH